jgi:hypothetical protein
MGFCASSPGVGRFRSVVSAVRCPLVPQDGSPRPLLKTNIVGKQLRRAYVYPTLPLQTRVFASANGPSKRIYPHFNRINPF